MITKTLGTLIIVFICILILPVTLGILGGVFGAVAGVFGAIFGVIGGLIGAIFGVIGWLFDSLFNWHFPFGFIHCNFFLLAAIVFVIAIASRKKPNR